MSIFFVTQIICCAYNIYAWYICIHTDRCIYMAGAWLTQSPPSLPNGQGDPMISGGLWRLIALPNQPFTRIENLRIHHLRRASRWPVPDLHTLVSIYTPWIDRHRVRSGRTCRRRSCMLFPRSLSAVSGCTPASWDLAALDLRHALWFQLVRPNWTDWHHSCPMREIG
jgi:hypothetical protein